MNIAVDSGPLTTGDSVRGIGVYARELLKALNIKGVDTSLENLSKYDIVHFTRFKPFSVSIPFFKPKNTKFILTIYDLIPLIYPDHYPAGMKGYIKLLINKYLIRKNIDAVITISETSKKDICRYFGLGPNIVFVTYLAPRAIFKQLNNKEWKTDIVKKYKLPDRFALYVGELNYNKNIPNLVRACRIAKIPLVIAGRQLTKDDMTNIEHPELKHLKYVDWTGVVRLGFVEDGELVKIYNLASVYIQPSFYEGFGLPLVEAIACKTPIVVSKTQCLVEILGGDFSYVDPNDPESIARGIDSPNINKTIMRKYSWQKTANLTRRIYKTILAYK